MSPDFELHDSQSRVYRNRTHMDAYTYREQTIQAHRIDSDTCHLPDAHTHSFEPTEYNAEMITQKQREKKKHKHRIGSLSYTHIQAAPYIKHYTQCSIVTAMVAVVLLCVCVCVSFCVCVSARVYRNTETHTTHRILSNILSYRTNQSLTECRRTVLYMRRVVSLSCL